MNAVFYPDLKIVPFADIKLQEYIQKSRMKKLAEVIRTEGYLKNPPIVSNFYNNTYLQLDGANRITAMSLLGYPNCLVQVVDYGDPTHVHLSSWSHLTGIDAKEFLKKVKTLPDVTVKEAKSFQHRTLMRPYVICVMAVRDNGVYEIAAETSFTELMKRIGDVVNLYADAPIERVYSGSPWTDESIALRFERYSELNAFIAFPTFSPQQIMTIVDRGVSMPAGVTRHVVYRRKLNVNLPLSYLVNPSLDEANKLLQKFLQHRSVRLYEEPVIYFE